MLYLLIELPRRHFDEPGGLLGAYYGRTAAGFGR
jgi:hypothetical protein